MNKSTQKQSILNDLKIGLTITPIDALTKHGCFRLAAVVFDLRKEGHKIITISRKKTDGKGKFASYRLYTA